LSLDCTSVNGTPVSFDTSSAVTPSRAISAAIC
jgi:hypothetical protein